MAGPYEMPSTARPRNELAQFEGADMPDVWLIIDMVLELRPGGRGWPITETVREPMPGGRGECGWVP